MTDSTTNAAPTGEVHPTDFIRDFVADDLKTGKHQQIVTRFPPEPNGYLHIGHAKSICLNFGIAHEFGGICNLRMDDTNPTKEERRVCRLDHGRREMAYRRLGRPLSRAEAPRPDPRGPPAQRQNRPLPTQCRFGPNRKSRIQKSKNLEPFYASDYFEQIYEYALQLIRQGQAYVCDLSPEETDEYRRNAKESPFRQRNVEENLDLFGRMKAGEFPDGARTLRAKIDMTAPNIWMRDPLIYRIRHAEHHHTGAQWCIYPMYDSPIA